MPQIEGSNIVKCTMATRAQESGYNVLPSVESLVRQS